VHDISDEPVAEALHRYGAMMRGGFYSVDSLKGVHVLVADNEAECRELLTAILHYCGALVTAVASADDALSVMALIKPDVLVADIVMRDRDGFWLISKVRALKPEDGGVVPAIAIGERSVPGERDRVRAAGFEVYFTKPLDPWELCRAITGLITPGGRAS
jgi:CheY-like chemotaxis protein